MMIAKGHPMATKTIKPAAPKAPVAAKRGVARKRAAPIGAAPAEPMPVLEPEPAAEPDKPNLLRAGLKALGNVRNDVVQHQSRVFEAILGIEPGQGWQGLVKKREAGAAKAAQEAFGLRKFEAVFDQRVASALERMGWPPVQALQALADQMAALQEEVAALRTELRHPKAPALKR
jgi:hypothetical protein